MIPRISTEDLPMASVLWNYLRHGQEVRPAKIGLVLGGHDINVALCAAELYHEGLFPFVVVTGGNRNVPCTGTAGHATTEAGVFSLELRRKGVPERNIIIESRANNTQENFTLSGEQLRLNNIPHETCLIVTKPYAERRALLTGQSQWPDKKLSITSENSTLDTYLQSMQYPKRVISMLVGEVQRLYHYGTCGFFSPVYIPAIVLNTARKLEEKGYNSRILPNVW